MHYNRHSKNGHVSNEVAGKFVRKYAPLLNNSKFTSELDKTILAEYFADMRSPHPGSWTHWYNRIKPIQDRVEAARQQAINAAKGQTNQRAISFSTHVEDNYFRGPGYGDERPARRTFSLWD